jgi:predicted AlkP superfamily phosphohydrolase/phosphomutase
VIPILLEEEWVEKVYTREQLSSDEPLDYDGQLLKNQFHPKWSGDLFPVSKEYYVLRSSVGTTHGTPYDYDTHVPLYFAGISIHDRMLEDSVETVDIAPTIADILGIQLDGVDGRVLELGESN